MTSFVAEILQGQRHREGAQEGSSSEQEMIPCSMQVLALLSAIDLPLFVDLQRRHV